jgi:hypothetical protein
MTSHPLIHQSPASLSYMTQDSQMRTDGLVWRFNQYHLEIVINASIQRIYPKELGILHQICGMFRLTTLSPGCHRNRGNIIIINIFAA